MQWIAVASINWVRPAAELAPAVPGRAIARTITPASVEPKTQGRQSAAEGLRMTRTKSDGPLRRPSAPICKKAALEFASLPRVTALGSAPSLGSNPTFKRVKLVDTIQALRPIHRAALGEIRCLRGPFCRTTLQDFMAAEPQFGSRGRNRKRQPDRRSRPVGRNTIDERSVAPPTMRRHQKILTHCR